MQLVAYGAQDIYITGNPQITFFKVVYRRHTNFSMESIQQVFNTSLKQTPTHFSTTISRNGDLLGRVWIEANLKYNAINWDENGSIFPGYLPCASGTGKSTGKKCEITNVISKTTNDKIFCLDNNDDNNGYIQWTNNTGCALIKESEIHIGGQLIDKHNSEFNDLYLLFNDHNRRSWKGLNNNVGRISYFMSGEYVPDLGYWECSKNDYDKKNFVLNECSNVGLQLYIPFQYWFCRNPGLYLPLIALQYHEVAIKFNTRDIRSLVNTNLNVSGSRINPIPQNIGIGSCLELWADYIYLDTDERRRFAQVSHEYLIEQVQSLENQPLRQSTNLNFNHPVKEIIWATRDKRVYQEDTCGTGGVNAKINVPENHETPGDVQQNDYFNYQSHISKKNLEFIGNNKVYQDFSTAKIIMNGMDRFAERKASYFSTVQPYQAGHRIPRKTCYLYSFSLRPEEHQPSGACNFSRIDTAQLELSNVECPNCVTLSIYAINYNVLRIMSGMGGLAYSN
jgi:hypothetical protein